MLLLTELFNVTGLKLLMGSKTWLGGGFTHKGILEARCDVGETEARQLVSGGMLLHNDDPRATMLSSIMDGKVIVKWFF